MGDVYVGMLLQEFSAVVGEAYKATSFDIIDNNLHGATGLCSTPSHGDVKIYKTVLEYSSDLHNYYAFIETYNLSNQT